MASKGLFYGKSGPNSFLAFPERLAGWQKLLPYGLLVSITVSLYGVSAYYNFVWDDLHYILENDRIREWSARNLLAIWSNSYFGQYAPIHISLLAAVNSVAQGTPFLFHVMQLLLHCGCVCLLYFVLGRMESARVAFLTALLFAVYPPNVENVAWISETKSTLALLFFLLSFWFYIRSRDRVPTHDGLWSCFFLALSLLSKISTLVAPAIFLLYDYCRRGSWRASKSWTAAGLVLISFTCAAIHLRTAHLGILEASNTLGDAALVDGLPPLSQSGYFGGFQVHLLHLPRIVLFYLRMVFVPYPLSAWHMFRIDTNFTWRLGIEWIALLFLIWVLYRSPREWQFWQLWFYLFLAPVLQLIPNPIWVADRYLYVPAIGAFVLLSKLFFEGLDRVSHRWLRFGLETAAAAVLITFAWQVHDYVPLWRNDLTLWRATAKNCQTSAYCHHAFGNSLFINGYSRLAVNELYRAVQIRPDPSYLVDLGDAYAEGLGDSHKAILAYQVALQTGRRLPPGAWPKIARAYYRSGQISEARGIIAKAEEAHAEDADLLIIKAFVEAKQGNPQAARGSLLQALSLSGEAPDVRRLLMNHWPYPAEAAQLLRELGLP